MKNVTQKQLKCTIFMCYEEFKDLVKKLCGNEAYVGIDSYGLDFAGPEGDSHAVIEALSEYYDIHITSIHADDCEEQPGVWICFKEKKQKKIVKLEFYDPDWDCNVSHRRGVVEAYYLKNPDEVKLERLKKMVEQRYDVFSILDLSEEERKNAEEFCNNIWEHIDNYIKENFEIVDIDSSFVINY